MTLAEFNSQIWPLLRQLNDNMNALIRPVCEQRGLTHAQVRALLAVCQSPCTVGELGRFMGTADANISSMCKRLERLGYLRRVRSDRDERVVYLQLTAAGTRLAQQLEQDISRRLQPVWDAQPQKFPDILQDISYLSAQLHQATLLANGSPSPQEKEQNL